ncbi:MAG: exonuclease SbcCD subunit D [Ruminococcaceae bacterium]|nr:exonuclease SbcCD subunit D [Oscillospiraceae bacterium]
MRFLHTADLHLDSPFASSDTFESESRRAEQRAVLGRIFELAKEEKCQMILIAGDLFDVKSLTPETEKYVTELFGGAGMPIVIAPGNHDPYMEGSFYSKTQFSDNVYIFSSNELQRFDFHELRTRVYGYAFTSTALTYSPLNGQPPAIRDGYTEILCAHADISAPVSRYCPLTVGDIKSFGLDYAALGHNHNQIGDILSGDESIRYCGFAEGRSFDELGDGGVYIVDVEYGVSPKIERKTVSNRRYEIRELDISDCEDTVALRHEISRICEEFGNDGRTFLRLCLVGNAEAGTVSDTEALERELSNGNVYLQIKDLTVPVANVSALKNDISLRGAFYNALLVGLNDPDPQVRARNTLALRIGLSAIDGGRIAGEGMKYEDN